MPVADAVALDRISLKGHCLLAAGIAALATASYADIEINGVGNASLDLPKVEVELRPQAVAGVASTADPLETEGIDLGDLLGDIGLGFSTTKITGYADTGASSFLIGEATAAAYGVTVQPGATFEDVGIGGSELFDISDRYTVDVYSSSPQVHRTLDVFGTVKQDTAVGIPGFDADDPLLDILKQYFDFNVFGMPILDEKVMVMDGRGLNQFAQGEIDVNDDLLDISRLSVVTHLYNKPQSAAGNAWNPSELDNPGVLRAEQADFVFDLDFADFGGFTETIGGTPPILAHNPMVGGGLSASVNETVDDRDDTPRVQLGMGSASSDASLLFDTGGTVSVLSHARLGELGIVFDEASGLFKDAEGVAVDPSLVFSVEISGVGGTSSLPGIFIDELSVPGYRIVNGEKVQEMLTFYEVPVVIADIGIEHPETQEEFILDGVFGMNLLFASTFVTGGVDQSGLGELPLIPGAFEFVVYDEVANSVMLTLTKGSDFLPGDADGDRDVDQDDVAFLAASFDQIGNWASGDFDGDGDVDLDDLTILGTHYGTGVSAGLISFDEALALTDLPLSVPEPAVLGAALFGLLISRRRRSG